MDILEELQHEYESKASKEDKEFFFEKLEVISSKYDKDDFWKQELRNLKGHAENSWYIKFKRNYSVKFSSFTYRDVQMADNLVWLAQKRFPNKKIIVWAANAHITKKNILKLTSLGTEADKVLKDDLYSLCFTSYEGTAGRIFMDKPYKVKSPSKNSFEQWIYNKGIDYGFVDFKGFKGKEKIFVMKGIGHNNIKLQWTKAYDGVIYIKEMYSCKRVKTEDSK